MFKKLNNQHNVLSIAAAASFLVSGFVFFGLCKSVDLWINGPADMLTSAIVGSCATAFLTLNFAGLGKFILTLRNLDL